MPQFDFRHLERDQVAKQNINILLDLMHQNTTMTLTDTLWLEMPKNSDDFITRLKNAPESSDDMLSDFIRWCYITTNNSQILRAVDRRNLLSLIATNYQCNTLTSIQQYNIKKIKNLSISIFAILLLVYKLGKPNKQSTSKITIGTYILLCYLSVLALNRKLSNEYILTNRDTVEDKANAFFTWLAKIAAYIPNLKPKSFAIYDSVNKNSTPNITPHYRNKREKDGNTQQETPKTQFNGNMTYSIN